MSNVQPAAHAASPKSTIRARMIMNPQSWHGTGDDSMVEHICALLKERGIDAEMALTTPQDHGTRLAHLAATEGFDLVIAVGGDGTVHDVAQGLLGTRVCLGIIPFGTINNIATSLHIPTDLEGACDVLAAQHCHPMDVGMINGKLFMEAVSIGFEAPLFPLGENARHNGFAGALGALIAGLRMIARSSAHSVTVEMDGKRKKVRAQQITICNTPRYGLGFVAAPDARVDDGLLDVVIARFARRRDLVRHYWSIMMGKRQVDQRVIVQRAKRIRLFSHTELPVAMDGAEAGTLPITVVVGPRRLQVCTGLATTELPPVSPMANILRAIAPSDKDVGSNVYTLPERVRRMQQLSSRYWVVAAVIAVFAWFTRKMGWWDRLPSPKSAPEKVLRERERSFAFTVVPFGLAAIFWRLRMHLEAMALLATGGMGIIGSFARRIKRSNPNLIEPDDATMRAVAGMGVLSAGLLASRKVTWRRQLFLGVLSVLGVWFSMAGRRSLDTPVRERDSIALGAGVGALWLGGTLSVLSWLRTGLMHVANVAEVPATGEEAIPKLDPVTDEGDVIAPVAMKVELERGDILLFGPDGTPNARMIEFLTRSHYHHIALYDGDGMVIEAMPGGVRRQALGQRRVTAIRLSISEEQRHTASNWAREHVGDVYDTRGIALIAFDRVFPGLRLGGSSANRFTCAVFIADAYLQAGVDLLPEHRWEDLVPGDFTYLIDTFPKRAK